jgi:dTDP-4-dehydrorhamnose reductase
VNIYGKSKASGELSVMKENPDAAILRASWLYSQYGKNFPKSIIKKLLTDDDPVTVVEDQWGQPTSCISLSKTIFELASRHDLVGVFHGSSRGEVSRFGFACQIAIDLGIDLNRIQPVSSSHVSSLAVRPNRSVLSHRRTQDAGLPLPLDWKDDFSSQASAIYKQVQLELS